MSEEVCCGHMSDCSVHNEPASQNGACDCPGVPGYEKKSHEKGCE